MKLITEMYDDFEILTEGKNKELKIKQSEISWSPVYDQTA